MYAARDDLDRAFSADMVDRLSIRPDDEDGSEAVARALTYAGGLADAALSVRFTLPLPVVPELLRDLVCDIAMARLASAGDATLTDDLKARDKQARADLKSIATGEMNLGLPSVSEGARPSPIVASTGGKIFTRDQMRGF